MAIGQITLTDLNDARTGVLSLYSTQPRVQTYDAIKGVYTPDFEDGINYAVIQPTLIIGADVIKTTNIDYTINDEEITNTSQIEGVAGYWTQTSNGMKVLCVGKNIDTSNSNLHIEARISNFTDPETGITMPDFVASYDITLLSNAATGSISFTSDYNLVVKKEDGSYDPTEITFTLDLKNYSFPDDYDKIGVQIWNETESLFYDEENGSYYWTFEKGAAAADLKRSFTYQFSTDSQVNGIYYAKFFKIRATGALQDTGLEGAQLGINLLTDGVVGKDAYTISIDDNKPTILCSEADGNYKTVEAGTRICKIVVLDGDGKKVGISSIIKEGGDSSATTISNITLTPALNATGAQVTLEWEKEATITETVVTYQLTLANQAKIFVSLTVLPLTSGKDGKDAGILIIEATPTDQFTTSSTQDITLTPYLYVGGELIEDDTLKYAWTIAGEEGENDEYIGASYLVSKNDVETFQVHICKVTYKGIEYSSRITVRNTIYPYYCELISSEGTTFKNGKVNTKITCYIYRSGEGAVVPPNATYTWYIVKDGETQEKQTGESNIYLFTGVIESTQTIYCDVSF